MPEDFRERIRLARQGGLDPNLVDRSKYDPSADPQGADRIARLLAEAIRPLRPATLVIWEDFEDIVLAHMVARVLDIRWVRCARNARRIEVTGAVEPDSATVLITDALRDRLPLNAISKAIALRGGKLTATLTIASSSSHGRGSNGLQHVSLLS